LSDPTPIFTILKVRELIIAPLTVTTTAVGLEVFGGLGVNEKGLLAEGKLTSHTAGALPRLYSGMLGSRFV
jgi:hypothetical protein